MNNGKDEESCIPVKEKKREKSMRTMGLLSFVVALRCPPLNGSRAYVKILKINETATLAPSSVTKRVMP